MTDITICIDCGTIDSSQTNQTDYIHLELAVKITHNPLTTDHLPPTTDNLPPTTDIPTA